MFLQKQNTETVVSVFFELCAYKFFFVSKHQRSLP